MKALSIRQPWASLIVAGHKDVENRTWSTRYRGPLLIHAPQSFASITADEIERRFGIRLHFDQLPRGGIVGAVELVDVVTQSTSPWFEGPLGFVLRDARALPFRTLPGRLAFFAVPDA
jgi:hypothetical protein